MFAKSFLPAASPAPSSADPPDASGRFRIPISKAVIPKRLLSLRNAFPSNTQAEHGRKRWLATYHGNHQRFSSQACREKLFGKLSRSDHVISRGVRFAQRDIVLAGMPEITPSDAWSAIQSRSDHTQKRRVLSGRSTAFAIRRFVWGSYRISIKKEMLDNLSVRRGNSSCARSHSRGQPVCSTRHCFSECA